MPEYGYLWHTEEDWIAYRQHKGQTYAPSPAEIERLVTESETFKTAREGRDRMEQNRGLSSTSASGLRTCRIINEQRGESE